MALITLGLSHHRAPVEVRTQYSFAESDIPDALARLRGLRGVDEAAMISTCNRTEIFAVTAPENEGLLLDWWRRERGGADLRPYIYQHRDLGSVRHSLRVACGLDSMVLGEPQILGQMKQSFQQAQHAHSLGPVLSRLFQHSFSVAKLVRTQTDIGAHPVSIAYAAVQMAKRIFADFRHCTAVLIGAGETGQLFARHLGQHGVGKLIIANRSLEKAQTLAKELHGYAISLNDLPTVLGEADLIVSSTSAPGTVLDKAMMDKALKSRRRKPVFAIDLAVPRDIAAEVGSLEDVYLYTVDDLKAVIGENLKLRQAAAQQAEGLVDHYAHEFTRWLESRDAASTIRALRQQARQHRDEVLDKAQRKLAQGVAVEDVLQFVADTLSNKLLHAPVSKLRGADAVEQALLLTSARQLFDLPEE